LINKLYYIKKKNEGEGGYLVRVRKATPWWLVDFSRDTREVVAVVASDDRRHWFWPPLPQQGVTATVDARPAARPPAPINLVAFILESFCFVSFFIYVWPFSFSCILVHASTSTS
jgi:hypothetical protein